MNFFRTEMLFFIWAIPVLFLVILYGMRRRKAIMERFASAHGLSVIAPDQVGPRRWIKASLVLGAVLFGAVALAGPKYGYRWQEIHQRGVDIVIALDCSRSMTAADIQPTRLERAKREVFDLLTMLKGDRVALVAFAGTAFLQCPLTLDYESFNLFLDTLSPDYLPVGGTNITAALTTAMESFDPESATEKAVILITDGENTGQGDPVKAAQDLKEKEIKLFCIGVGKEEGVPITEPDGGFKKDRKGQIILSRLDEHTLKQLAVVTGGTYVRSVAGDMDLDAIYTDEIRGKMEASELASGRKQIWEDRFQWPLALSILCLVAELMLPVTRKTAVVLAAVIILSFPAGQTARADETRDGIDAYEKGEFDTALKHFVDAQLEAPDRAERLYNVADAYYKTGNFDAAADHYQQVLETDDEALKKKALFNLGNTEFRRGNGEKAMEHYESVLSMDPDDRLAKENLEFVKQALTQQKQQQQSQEGQKDKDQKDSDQDRKDKGQGDESKQEQQPEQQKSQDGQEQQSSDEGNQEEQQSPEFGDEMDDEQAQAGQQPQPSQEDAGDESKRPEQSAQAGDLQKDPGQAERMLNRLKDEPGRAMMPNTGKQRVDKDW